jgi:hypothetical protein
VAVELWLFKLTPTLVNADNGAFDIVDADLNTALPIGVIDFQAANYKATVSNSFCKGTINGGPAVLAATTSGSANIFGVLVSRGAPTYGSASALVVTLTVTQF